MLQAFGNSSCFLLQLRVAGSPKIIPGSRTSKPFLLSSASSANGGSGYFAACWRYISMAFPSSGCLLNSSLFIPVVACATIASEVMSFTSVTSFQSHVSLVSTIQVAAETTAWWPKGSRNKIHRSHIRNIFLRLFQGYCLWAASMFSANEKCIQPSLYR